MAVSIAPAACWLRRKLRVLAEAIETVKQFGYTLTDG